MTLFSSLRLRFGRSKVVDVAPRDESLSELAAKLAEKRGPNVTAGVPQPIANPVDGLVEHAKGVRIVNTGREHDYLDKNV